MPLSLLQITSASPLHSTLHHLSPTSFLPKSLFPNFELEPRALKRWIFSTKTSLRGRTKAAPKTSTTHASLLETPVLWAGRLCIFYALIKAGLAGSQENPFVSDLEIGGSDEAGDLGFSKWTQSILGKPGIDAAYGSQPSEKKILFRVNASPCKDSDQMRALMQ